MDLPIIRQPVDRDFQKISSPFGDRIHPITGEKKFHYGIDYAMPIGSNVYSCTYGECVLKKIDDEDGFGNWLLIHSVFPEGEKNMSWFFFYTHLSKCKITEGDLVEPGQVIGLSGDSGASTGPHLHFQVCREDASKANYDKYAVDPNLLFDNPKAKQDALQRLKVLASEFSTLLEQIDDKC